jgi:hypothetical protein
VSEIGQIKAHLVADSTEWVQGLEKGAQAMAAFEKKQTAQLRKIEREQKAAAKAAADAAKQSAADMKAFGDTATQVAGKLSAFAGDIAQAAAAADDLTDSLAGAFGPRAEEMSGVIQKLGTGLGVFSDQAVAGAAKQLEKFGIATEQNLTRVVDIAAKTGQSVEGISVAFGKFEKFGDSKSILALQKQLGVTGAEMEQFGAKTDAAGKVLADTPARAEAARAAMQAIVDTKFAGAASAMADDSARLAGEIELLKREVGASAHSFKESLAPAMLDVVQGIRGLSPELKGAAGLMLDFGSMAVSGGAQALTAAANFAILTQSTAGGVIAAKAATLATTALKVATIELSLGFGGAVIAVAAIAAGVAAYITVLNDANKAAESLLVTEEKRARGLHDNKNLLGMSAKDAKRLGKTSADASSLVQGLQDQAEKAGAVGSPERTKVEKQIAGAQKLKADLAAMEAAEKSKKSKPAGDLDAPSAKEQAKLDKLKDKQRKTDAAAAEKVRKQELNAEVATVTQGLAARKITAEQAIKSLEEIKSTHAKTAEERLAIDGKIASLTGQLENKKAADAKKAEAAKTAETKKATREREAEEKRAEAERKRESAKAQREQAKAEKDALKERKQTSVQAAKETAQESRAAADQAAKASEPAFTPFGSTIPQFGGGPIAGTLDERQAAAAEADAKKRATGMASNTAERDRMVSRGGVMGARAALGKRAQEWIAAKSADQHKKATDQIEASKWGDQGALMKHIIAENPGVDPGTAAKIGSTDGVKATKGKKMDAGGGVIGGIGFGPDQVAEGVVSALQDAPLQIVVNVNGKQAGTFSGTAGDLARASNVVNPRVPLGGA